MRSPDKILFFIICIFLLTCNEEKCNCIVTTQQEQNLYSIDSIIGNPEVIVINRNWMNAYNEPTLLDSKNETYRFLFEGGFGNTVICRIENDADKYIAYIKESPKANNNQKLKAIKKEIPESTWKSIKSSLNQNCFWTYLSTNDRNGLDGATFILEGYSKKILAQK